MKLKCPNCHSKEIKNSHENIYICEHCKKRYNLKHGILFEIEKEE
jgi:ribosomal protein L37AE/L43A